MRLPLAILTLLAPLPALALELHSMRSSQTDLAVTGLLSGAPQRVVRYVRWADLRALPTRQVALNEEFMKGPQAVTALFLSDFLRALPGLKGADTLLASCSDGYASVFGPGFIDKWRPFIVLEINGKGPGSWGDLAYDPGPYAITVSDSVAPGVSTLRDVRHKRPWGVTVIEVASYAETYRAVYSGPWAELTSSEQDGREIWINSCASCHKGPGGIFGGTKAARPWEVLEAYAGHDRPFFVKYVRSPTSLVPCAKMEPHPEYTDGEMSDLIAFMVMGNRVP